MKSDFYRLTYYGLDYRGDVINYSFESHIQQDMHDHYEACKGNQQFKKFKLSFVSWEMDME